MGTQDKFQSCKTQTEKVILFWKNSLYVSVIQVMVVLRGKNKSNWPSGELDTWFLTTGSCLSARLWVSTCFKP